MLRCCSSSKPWSRYWKMHSAPFTSNNLKMSFIQCGLSWSFVVLLHQAGASSSGFTKKACASLSSKKITKTRRIPQPRSNDQPKNHQQGHCFVTSPSLNGIWKVAIWSNHGFLLHMAQSHRQSILGILPRTLACGDVQFYLKTWKWLKRWSQYYLPMIPILPMCSWSEMTSLAHNPRAWITPRHRKTRPWNGCSPGGKSWPKGRKASSSACTFCKQHATQLWNANPWYLIIVQEWLAMTSLSSCLHLVDLLAGFSIRGEHHWIRSHRKICVEEIVPMPDPVASRTVSSPQSV